MIYARQGNPEYQESPLYLLPDCFPDNIAVCGNRDYEERLSEVFERVRKVLEEEELDDAIHDITKHRGGYWCDYYKNVTEVINDLLPPEKGKYSTQDIHALKMFVNKYPESRSYEKEDIICSVLSIVTKRDWDHRTIRGVTQSDWNEIYYPVNEWNDKKLDNFETMYWNTGSEWCIHDGDAEPETPEDIEGYWIYCCSWNEEGVRKEIANACGVSESDVVMYKYVGERYMPIYELAS